MIPMMIPNESLDDAAAEAIGDIVAVGSTVGIAVGGVFVITAVMLLTTIATPEEAMNDAAKEAPDELSMSTEIMFDALLVVGADTLKITERPLLPLPPINLSILLAKLMLLLLLIALLESEMFNKATLL